MVDGNSADMNVVDFGDGTYGIRFTYTENGAAKQMWAHLDRPQACLVRDQFIKYLGFGDSHSRGGGN